MAFPFIFESNFAAGDSLEWDSETDTVGQLDFPNFRELARAPDSNSAPSSGAHCMRAVLSGGTADAFVLEGDINIAAAANNFIKFDILFTSDFTGTADDTFSLFEAQGTAAAIQVVCGARIVAATNVINLGIGELAATSFTSEPILRNTWYTVELDITIDNAGANDGTIDLFVTKIGDTAQTVISAAQVATLDQIAVIQGVLGIQDHLATTTGTILFDNFVHDDARVFPRTDLFPYEKLITKTDSIFVGAGELSRVELLSGAGTDNVLTVFDTSNSVITDASNIVLELKNTANNEVVAAPLSGHSLRLDRGCHIVLSGTNPRALVKINKTAAYGSSGVVRRHGLQNGSLK